MIAYKPETAARYGVGRQMKPKYTAARYPVTLSGKDRGEVEMHPYGVYHPRHKGIELFITSHKNPINILMSNLQDIANPACRKDYKQMLKFSHRPTQNIILDARKYNMATKKTNRCRYSKVGRRYPIGRGGRGAILSDESDGAVLSDESDESDESDGSDGAGTSPTHSTTLHPLHHTLPHSTTLYHTPPHSTTLYHTPPHSTTLHHSTTPHPTILSSPTAPPADPTG